VSDTDRHKGRCLVCHHTGDGIRNINLYVIGSEGLDVCYQCEMVILDMVKHLLFAAGRARMMTMKELKKGES
jgi:hypothetical protein